MSVKRKASNARISDEDDEITHVCDDSSQRLRPEPQGHQVVKKSKVSKKTARNVGVPAGCKVESVPPDVVEQVNRPNTQQPYAMMDHARRANILHHPVVVDHANRPINMAVYPGAPCWCNQLSGDMRAIRELIGAVSNGIHCILQKVHMDQVHNAEVMSKMLNSVEVIADTVTHLPLAQLQECDQYLLEDIGNIDTRRNGTNTDPYYAPGDEQVPPNQPPANGNYI
ncbi:unnamed protein product [Cercopithifilaria johnstoni]|uniref:Uncharacterized protein n=1 Tax=Cercopithifilaria johnstoni TaxID=2874296 RepID=A0A8J2MBE6_9BILA|nr:unnamed protein product [Cercopithifilaria johnstoni]